MEQTIKNWKKKKKGFKIYNKRKKHSLEEVLTEEKEKIDNNFVYDPERKIYSEYI